MVNIFDYGYSEYPALKRLYKINLPYRFSKS